MRSFQLKRILFLVAYFVNSSFLFAQFKLQPEFRKIDEENGLSDNKVQCVYKDRNEFVWIGTASGLNLMNGSDITVFKHERTNPNSVSNNNITAISGDNKGLIWIGTGKGLNSFNPSLHLFSYFSLDNFPAKNNTDGYVTALAIDKKNNVYAGTEHGLFFLKAGDKKARQIEIPGAPALSQKNNSITGLTFDSSGILWITSYNGLWKYIPGKKQAAQIIVSNTLFTHLLIDATGKIWIGTYNQGLRSYDPFKKKLSSFGNVENAIALTQVKVAGDNNDLWIGGPFIVFDILHRSFFHLTPPEDFPKNIDIQNVYTSDDNWLWLGTEKGLYFCDPSKSAFLHHTFSRPVTSQQIALLEWNDKVLVGGSGKNFLKIYDSQLVEKDNFSKNIQPDISCLSLTFSGKDQLIAGTSEGIATINLITRKVQFDHLQFLAKDNSSGNFITNVFKDNEHRLWLYPWRKGIWRSDSGEQHFSPVLRNFTNENGYPKPLVIADAVQDKNNDLWFADLDEGIIYYNKTTNQFSKPFARQLGNFYTSSQILAYQNYYYSFTASEILKWNADNKILQIIALPSEFDKQISSMAFDSSRHLWIATGKGLLEYDL
ncbi:MAG TPA: two-component regulator propeller domain-containing protein, partial [Hanamia sp.]|nr:two-component regulator propeller domain-containing protein [Hanamia sp.]